ncbi:hypothetical protein [Aquilutibacter rugosus]|uniref:hypothetical protein n=1 Tax=Aquilutibacter rugosus TaxID=3115820 RepID=UPI002F3E9514
MSDSLHPIYFIRHVSDWQEVAKRTGHPTAQEFLIENQLIAIHFDGIESWKSSEYKNRSGKSAIRILNLLDEQDDSQPCAYVFATYTINCNNRVYLGEAVPGSKMYLKEFLEVESAEPLKLLQLKNFRELGRDEFPHVHLLPPKLSTLVHWKQCARAANRFIQGAEPDIEEPDSYLPSALETICGEYLRINGLKALLYRAGGQLKHWDFIGISSENDRRIFAQVKQHHSARELKAFLEFAQEEPTSRYILFTGNPTSIDRLENVEIIDVRRAILAIKGYEKLGPSYLEMIARA